MPLTGRPNHDIPVELNAGKPRKQAIAIALNKEREMKKRASDAVVPVEIKTAQPPKKSGFNGNSVVMTAEQARTAYAPKSKEQMTHAIRDEHEEEGFEHPDHRHRPLQPHEDIAKDAIDPKIQANRTVAAVRSLLRQAHIPESEISLSIVREAAAEGMSARAIFEEFKKEFDDTAVDSKTSGKDAKTTPEEFMRAGGRYEQDGRWKKAEAEYRKALSAAKEVGDSKVMRDAYEAALEMKRHTEHGAKDAEVKPVRVNPAPMAKLIPVSKAKHAKDAATPKWQPDSPNKEKLEGLHQELTRMGYKFKHSTSTGKKGELAHVYKADGTPGTVIYERKNGNHSAGRAGDVLPV